MYPSKLFLALDEGALKAEALATLGLSAGLTSPGDCREEFSWQQQDPNDWAALLESLAASQPDALLLDVECLKGDLGAAVRQVQSRSPQTKVVAMHALSDSASILGAMRAGASEFVHSPFADTLFPALERLHQTAKHASGKREGKLIAFLSAKGGCGSTTLACHIAAELQRQTQSDVLLADFDFTSGVLGFLMKRSCDYSILDAIKNLSRLDERLWKAMIDQSQPGLSVLPAPASIAHGEYPELSEFKQVLRFMRTVHDWTVIDLGRSLTRTARAVLDEVDQMFLVSTLEVISLHGVKTIVGGLAGEDVNLQKLQLILNRTPKMMDITTDELQKILGRPVYATLPNDYPGLYSSYSSGTLLPAKNRLAEHFARLASRIAGKPAAGSAKKRFALFG